MQMFGMKHALLLSIFFVSSLCNDRPKIITNITPQVVRETGENATLACYVDNPEDYVVSWVKVNRDNPSDQTVLSFGTKLSVKNPRFLVTATSDSLVLNIKDIEFTDAAVYQCQVFVSDTYKDTAPVELLIKHPPKIIKDIEVNPTPAVLNSTVELVCTAEGYPKPNISWKRAGDALIPAGGNIYNGTVLKINDVSHQDRGIYYCIADNGIGQPDQRIVNFEVEFPPKITAPRPRVAQALDYDIELECKIEGFPAPQVSWYKDGSQILNEGDYSITNTATINDVTNSVLRVITVESSQYGDYVCKASNKLGSSEAKINLFDSVVAVYPWQAFARN
ncbi:lachesin-like [Sitodiplosis mosellana]|uniref:lachesin-like n=1 Tax=Sitodiplosis mosellana TaxID=263140 RepID=UPI00244454EE|nr:lachesin-like [Sitodiplosis mosellana]XP_055312667.1 lachesin-like [Sitodiplosis mosellana]XP_055312668.1 lachesin-like [Sitodiplosis mosellana]XP_055312669.1 lachesin-like [Sitodiplosis mosellana]